MIVQSRITDFFTPKPQVKREPTAQNTLMSHQEAMDHIIRDPDLDPKHFRHAYGALTGFTPNEKTFDEYMREYPNEPFPTCTYFSYN